MDVAHHVGTLLARLGADHVFGVVGSGNFHVTNALIAAGARFVPAAHEGGAATMADAYARCSGRVGVLSVHQGPGVTNALTGITEAAKSRTPLIVLAPEATAPRSNFAIGLAEVAGAVGAHFHRVHAATATADVMTAWRLATSGGTVVLALPLDEQAAPAPEAPVPPPGGEVRAVDSPDPDEDSMAALAGALRSARRPVFIAGRGAARVPYAETREVLLRLAERCGALLATSAAAKGLFAGDPWNLDVSGGFASPLAASLIAGADVLVAWGASLNMWTTRQGALIPKDATVVRVDHDPAALATPLIAPAAGEIRLRGDVRRVAGLVLDRLDGHRASGWRDAELAGRLRASVRWRDVPYVADVPHDGDAPDGRMDARTLTIALDDLLPPHRVVAVDSGNFMGYPAMYLSVPDASGFCMTQAYQSVGLGLASAIGAALAQPDRLAVAALGDGGFLMSVAELTTVTRLGLPLVIIVYDDAAFGAEVYHFGPDGFPLDTVRFPEPPVAAIAAGFGCAAVTVRGVPDLAGVREWLDGARDRPLVIDAKVGADRGAWWLEEAFRGH